jgi:GNAT superfamily N-acetyltransferase
MTIRDAVEADVPLIVRLIKGLAEYEQLQDEAVATEDAIRDGLFGARRFAEVVIAEDERTPVGFALFFHNYSTFLGKPGLYLEDLFVVPDARGKGVGKALLLHLRELAIARGCGRMEWSVLDWNAPAIGFYKKIGATVMDDWRICRLTLPRPTSTRTSTQERSSP